jgi:predicted lipoprotein
VNTLRSDVLNNFSANVASATYADLHAKAQQLSTSINDFNSNPTQATLDASRTNWRTARAAWEQSEAFLFGPVASDNVDPRIDTWPINTTDLQTLMADNDSFPQTLINNLPDELKGFHPIEFLLFGENGDKQATDFSEKEKALLAALAQNLLNLTHGLSEAWSPDQSGSFYFQFKNAGNGSNQYTTQLAAYEEMVNAMAGICDEVANAKIGEPFAAQDPTLEESPYAENSMTDFTHNITGVSNVYTGKYTADGKGLEDWVKEYNLSLDQTIKSKIQAAIDALENVTHPFGQAITTQPVQVQHAIDAINDLKETLETELLPLVQQNIN